MSDRGPGDVGEARADVDSAETAAETLPFFAGRFVEALRGFVARRVPPQDVDDVLQDVLLRLHRGAAELHTPSRWRSWAYGVARNTIVDSYRARRPGGSEQVMVDELQDPRSHEAAGFGCYAGDHDVHEEVVGCLRPTAESLSAPYRDALLMADFEGLPQHEVARRLGLSLSGAKSRVQRARRMLAESLRACCEVALGSDGRAVDFRRRRPR